MYLVHESYLSLIKANIFCHADLGGARQTPPPPHTIENSNFLNLNSKITENMSRTPSPPSNLNIPRTPPPLPSGKIFWIRACLWYYQVLYRGIDFDLVKLLMIS